FYRDILDRIVKPAVGTMKADKLSRHQIGRLHSSLADTPFQANRVLAVIASMYTFAGRAGIVPEGTNPASGIDRYKEGRRGRFLTGEELERLGSAIREAETKWTNLGLTPSTCRAPGALPESPQLRGQRFACFYSPAAACGKSCICNGSTSILSAAVCFCPTARAAGRLSSSTPLLSRCSTR